MQPTLLLLSGHRTEKGVHDAGAVPPAGGEAAGTCGIPVSSRYGGAAAAPPAGGNPRHSGGSGLPAVPDHKRDAAGGAGRDRPGGAGGA